MNKPQIEIWDSVGLGIIVRYPSGVLVSNQTGGTSCLHPNVEGIYLPFHNDYDENDKTFSSPEIDFDGCFTDSKYDGSGACSGIDEEDVKRLEAILKKYSMDSFIRINMNKMKESHEAWIHIFIESDEKNPYSLFKGFDPYPRQGILTWSNSD